MEVGVAQTVVLTSIIIGGAVGMFVVMRLPRSPVQEPLDEKQETSPKKHTNPNIKKHIKTMLKRFGILFAAHIPGVFVGTLISAPLNDVPFNLGEIMGAVVLSPIEMMFGFSILSDFSHGCMKFYVLSGLILAVISFAWGMIKPGWPPCLCMFVGTVFWNLGNLVILPIMMSV